MASRTSMNITGGALGRREPCAKCLNPVFLAERLNVGTQLYHRTCFRCARCNNQLSLANCYETETGQYCCETCPDEEVDKAKPELFKNMQSSESFLEKLNRIDQFRNRSLSDEEKQTGLQKFEDDDYSADFENALEDSSSEKIYQDDSFMSKARTEFLSTHLMNQDRGDALVSAINMKIDEDSPPLLPNTEPPDEITSLTNIDLSISDNCARTTNTSVNNLDLADTVNNSKISVSNQQDTASDTMPEETTALRENSTKDTNRSSLVKSRMLLFEANDKKTDEPDSIRNKVNIVSKYFNISDVQNSDLKSKVPSKSDADISVITISSDNSLLTKDENSIVEISDSSLSLNDSRIEERDYKISKSQPISVSSETLDESSKCDDYKTVRSEINSDSLAIFPSVSDVNSPAENKENSISASSEILEKVNSEIVIKSNLIVEEITSSIERNLKENNIPKEDSTSSKSTENFENSSNNIVTKSHLPEEKNISSPDTNLKENSTPEEPSTSVDLQNKSNDSVFYSEVNIADPILNVNLKSNEENKTDSILTRSLLENNSDEISPVAIDINLFDSNNALKPEEYPKDLNPFDDDDKDDVPMKSSRQIIKPSREDLTILTPEDQVRRKSMNPFGSSDEEEEKVEIKSKPPRPPLPAARKDERKMVKAPRISLNPFWSDEEDQKDDANRPIPKPRTKKRKLILATQTFEISSQNNNDSLSRNFETPEPKPRKSGLSNAGDRYDSNSSLSSINSSLSHTPGRRKKPAPPPPSFGTILSSPQNSKHSTPCTSAQQSPKSTPKLRKNRKAPLPPTSTPVLPSLNSPNTANYSSINDSTNVNNVSDAPSLISETEIEREKIDKDEKNRNRQSQSISSSVLSDGDSLSLSQQSSTGDKSTHGQWKRKKGPAPARPVPQRRQIRPLPLVELRRELDIIEMQQQGLEKQGVKLEQLIREKCEIPGACDDMILSPEVEELVLELFELVNEKNELFRRQAELMYLRRQQRLEEEYADIEYQIRCLMEQPERNKTDSDKAREEELINRLVEVVERRNEIVECLEMDRVREAEEDESISTRLTEIATRREEELQSKPETPIKLSKKEKKKIKKEKKLKEKGKTVDADKDIDESENISLESVKTEKKKKKWFMHK